MDRGTKIIIALAAAGLLLMLITLGHDFFSKPPSNAQQGRAPSSVVMLL